MVSFLSFRYHLVAFQPKDLYILLLFNSKKYLVITIMTKKILQFGSIIALLLVLVSSFVAANPDFSAYPQFKDDYDFLNSRLTWVQGNLGTEQQSFLDLSAKSTTTIYDWKDLQVEIQTTQKDATDFKAKSDSIVQQLLAFNTIESKKLAQEFSALSNQYTLVLTNSGEVWAHTQDKITTLQNEKLYNQYLIVNKAYKKANFLLHPVLHDMTSVVNSNQGLDQALTTHKNADDLWMTYFDIRTQAQLWGNTAIDQKNDEYEAKFQEIDLGTLDVQQQIKNKEAQLDIYINDKAEVEFKELDKTYSLLETQFNLTSDSLGKAQCAQNAAAIDALKAQLNDIMPKIADKISLIGSRNIILINMPTLQDIHTKYYTQYDTYDALGKKINTLVETPFDKTTCQNGVPTPPPAGNNIPPTFAAIGNKAIKIGEKIEFTLTAADAENDPLTYSASSLPLGATFDVNTHLFSWTPAQIGIYTITFSINDGKNKDVPQQVTITVTATDVVLSPEQQKYSDLKKSYDSFSDDYTSYKQKLDTANSKKNQVDIDKYKKKLSTLDKNLKDLKKETIDLLDTVENQKNTDALQQNIKDLQDDIDSTRKKIDIALNGKPQSKQAVSQTSSAAYLNPQNDVVVQNLPNFAPSSTEDNQSADAASTMPLVFLIGGVIVILAVIVFLIALILA